MLPNVSYVNTSEREYFMKIKLKYLYEFFTAIASTLVATTIYAQPYPTKPVKVFTPWSDGFPANSARLYAKELSDRYKQPFIVDAKPGAGGEVAAKQVISAPADGYTLLITGSSITIRAATDEKNADGERDLQPIAQITTTPYVIVAKSGKYINFKNLLSVVRANPGTVNFASAGVGTGMHYLGELINSNAGVQMVHIPYSTGSKQLQAVMAGDVDIAIISLVTALPQIKSGALEALAVSSVKRSRVAPTIPTLSELGLQDIPSMGAWIAIFGPKGMDPNIVRSLSDKITAISNDPAVIETVTSWGAEIPDARVSALQDVLQSEKRSWVKLIKEKNFGTNN